MAEYPLLQIGDGLPDWRDNPTKDDDTSETDEDELPESGFPEDIAKMLGFDPTKLTE